MGEPPAVLAPSPVGGALAHAGILGLKIGASGSSCAWD